MINTRVIISGIEYTELPYIKGENTITDNKGTSYCSMTLENNNGKYADSFSIGNDVKVLAGKGELANLIGYWRFNESGNVMQDELTNNPFVLVSGTVGFSSNGIMGSAVSFPGSSYIAGSVITKTGDIYNLNTSPDHTFTFWANIREEASGGGFFSNAIAGFPTTYPAFSLRPTDGYFLYQFPSLGDTISGPKIGTLTGSWTFLACGYKSSNGYGFIYQNGSLVGSGTLAGLIGDTVANKFKIGYDEVTGLYTSGLIDDFRVYKAALDENQIKELYNSGLGTLDYNIFTGFIEDVNYMSKGDFRDKIDIQCRDYSARLLDTTVQPITLSNDIGSMVRYIVINNSSGVSVNNVRNTGITMTKSFNHPRVWDAVNDLAERAGYVAYVDNFRDLHFEPRKSISANLNLGSDNIVTINYDISRKGMANRIWVYGDRQFSGYQEIKTSTGGSSYSLTYKPHDLGVYRLGSSLKGGVYNMIELNTVSGIDYLVDYNSRTVYFQSGTTINHNSIPPATGSIVFIYSRDLPIAKFGQNDTSVLLFGPKEDVIIDKSIKDPIEAENIVTQKINDSDPLTELNINYIGWDELKPATTVDLTLNNIGVNVSGISIISSSYKFDDKTIFEESPITLRLSKKIPDLTDKIKDINDRITNLEGADANETDVLTRLFYDNSQVTIVGSRYTMATRPINDSFIDGHPMNGVLGEVNPLTAGSIISGGAFITGAGIGYDRAIKLGSPAYVSIPNGSFLTNILSGGTISCWVKLDASPADQNSSLGTIWNPLGTGSRGLFFGISATGSPNQYPNEAFIQYGVVAAAVRASTTGSLIIGEWTHIAATWSKTQASNIYYNGSLQGTNANPTAQMQALFQADTELGRQTTLRYISGALDDMRLFNRPLSTAEIGSLYRKADHKNGLIACYKFDEGVGSKAWNSASVEMATGDAILHYRLNISGESIVDEASRVIGSAVNGGGEWVTGVYNNGSAIRISGLNYFSMFNGNNQFKFSNGSQFSLSVWCNIRSGGFQAGAAEGVFIKGTTSVCNYGIDIFSGTIPFHRFGSRNGPNAMTVSAPGLPLGEWNHIVGTYNGSNLMQIFYNGSPGSTFNTGGDAFVSNGAGSLIIGRNGVLTGNIGSELIYDIDEPRIYNRVLSQSEILNLYYGKSIQPLLGDRRGGTTIILSGGNNYSVTGSYNDGQGPQIIHIFG